MKNSEVVSVKLKQDSIWWVAIVDRKRIRNKKWSTKYNAKIGVLRHLNACYDGNLKQAWLPRADRYVFYKNWVNPSGHRIEFK